jgi:hypothetical protein
VFGGYNYEDGPLSSFELFSPVNEVFWRTGEMSAPRAGCAAVLLRNGIVMIIGGMGSKGATNTCEFYDPWTNIFYRAAAKLWFSVTGHTATLLANGSVLVAGGRNADAFYRITQIYSPETDEFRCGPEMIECRCGHTATTLPNGKVLFTGGVDFKPSKSTEIYDPDTRQFCAGPDMTSRRSESFSISRPDGKVIIGGGEPNSSSHTTELYDPLTNSFSPHLELKGGGVDFGRVQSAASNY